jgi:hypothetical protein
MAVRSSFNLKGILDIVRGKTHGGIGISQIIDGVEAKSIEMLVPAASNWINIPLSFNSGVDEALVVYLYTASSLVIEIADNPGDTVQVGLKGHGFWTFTPGKGITAIRAKNESTSVNTTLELTYGCLQSVGDEPEYWQE